MAPAHGNFFNIIGNYSWNIRSSILFLKALQEHTIFPENNQNKSIMPGKILITYASRAGSTAGEAEVVGLTLAEAGAQVEAHFYPEQ
jgi:hypothetical protein